MPGIFIFTGPSGVGKTTITNALLKTNPSFSRVITHTTRRPRKDEIKNKDYKFVTKDFFLKKIKNNELFEHAKVYGNHYGSLKSEVFNLLNLGKNILFIIDVQGAEKMKKIYPSAKVIFLEPPTIEELSNRLKKRGKDSPEEINKRVKTAKAEMLKKNLFDYSLLNDNLEEAIREAIDIISKEKSQ